ncbi:hypothetical protein [Paenibacillus apiarius]|uniref:hypothetical protein n=1 Tax=Paenibacillus apiarius TaxID=46240 RepID=UPI003B3A3B7E
MRYANLLTDAVFSSNMTYQQIVDKCKKRNVRISRSYLSKICTGSMPPASDEINKALVDVLSPVSGLTYRELAVAKYKEIIPSEVLEALASGM